MKFTKKLKYNKIIQTKYNILKIDDETNVKKHKKRLFYIDVEM